MAATNPKKNAFVEKKLPPELHKSSSFAGRSLSFEDMVKRRTSSETRRTIKREVRDARYGLDSRAALRAFRLIGGFDGIKLDELRHMIGTVSDSHIRTTLLNQLSDIFAQFDADDNGILDVLEFENMMHSSTILQQAIYELLERADEEERHEYMDTARDDMKENTGMIWIIDCVSVLSTLLYVVILAVQMDVSPDAIGWHYVELVFLIFFSLEILMRCWLDSRRNKAVLAPALVFDVAITLVGWVELCLGSASIVTAFRWVRILRIFRYSRLLRFSWYCHELRLVVEGIRAALKTSCWGLAMILLLVLVWAILIRTTLEKGWSPDDDGIIRTYHSTILESMLAVFRCMALRADGACQEKPKLTGTLNVFWALTETFIFIGILNVLTSIYVLQSSENEKRIQHRMNKYTYCTDTERLQKLDRLLRTLIHPSREQSNPKDRNAVEVALKIHTEHPEVAARIPNLEMQIVQFAQHIQDAKRIHQSAMDVYEAQEVGECKELRSIPSAKTFVSNGIERLLVDDDAGANNSLSLPMAPVGAPQVMLVQEQEDLAMILLEADDVQRFMKHVIYPCSNWADTSKAGPSGDIWKASKGLCDEAIDPGVKSLERIEQKVATKYGGRYERNRDYSRLSLIYNSVQHLIRAIPQFLEYRMENDHFQVVSLENRFLEPHPLGWRDITLLVKVYAGAEHHDSFHIMELQLRLRRLAEICHEGHRFYEQIRAHLPEDLVTKILDRLVTDTTLDLGITKAEWLQCLPNKEVKKLLDKLCIPKRARKSLYDVIDIDGSGTVTSSELQEMLLLVKDPIYAHEVAGCHFRVQDIQRVLQQRVEPQLSMISHYAARSLEENIFLFEEMFLRMKNILLYNGDGESSNGVSNTASPVAMGKTSSGSNGTSSSTVNSNSKTMIERRHILLRENSRAPLGRAWGLGHILEHPDIPNAESVGFESDESFRGSAKLSSVGRSQGLEPLASIRAIRSQGLEPLASIRSIRSQGLDALRIGRSQGLEPFRFGRSHGLDSFRLDRSQGFESFGRRRQQGTQSPPGEIESLRNQSSDSLDLPNSTLLWL